MSNYELLRLRNIQRNEAKLASLGLVGLTSKKKKTPAKAKTAKAKEKVTKQRKPPAKNSPYVFPQTKNNWYTRYEELVEFKKQYGHITVPMKYSKPLQSWVKRQKTQYSNYKLGLKHSLDDEKIGLLCDLGVEEFWFGVNMKKKKKTKLVARTKANKSLWEVNDVDGEEIGSVDSYSEDELLYGGKHKRTQRISSSMQREVEGLKSPKWMDGHSSEEDEYHRPRSSVSAKKKTTTTMTNKNPNKQASSTKDVRKKSNKSKQRSARVFSSEDSASDRSDQYYSEDESDGRRSRRRGNKVKRQEERKTYDNFYSDEDSERNKSTRRGRHRYEEYSDVDSIKYSRRGRDDKRSYRKSTGRKLVRDYSDDEQRSSVGVESKRRRGASKATIKPPTKTTRVLPPFKRKRPMKSSLELIEPVEGERTPEASMPRPTKRKGIVSEEPERPTKRYRKEFISDYSRSGYESTSSNSYSKESSLSTSSVSLASTTSTRSSSLKPMNEVVFMQQTKTLRTPNPPHDDLRSLMDERRELLMEYACAHARNIERMRHMPREIYELESIEKMLIQSGSMVPNNIDGVKQLELIAKTSSAVMMEKLLCPEQLMFRGQTSGSIESSSPQRIGLIADSLFGPQPMPHVQNAGLLEGPSLGGERKHLAEAILYGENGEY